jgi:hypothetical protein
VGLELSVDCPTGISDSGRVNPVDFDQLLDGRIQVVNSFGYSGNRVGKEQGNFKETD